MVPANNADAQPETVGAAAAQQPTNAPDAAKSDAAEGTDWKAMARKWERMAKDNAAAAKKLQDLEDAQKTEAQKQADRIAQLEAVNKAYQQAEERRSWARKIAGEDAYKGIPAEALRGDTEEEMREHADLLARLIQPAATTTAGKLPPIPAATQQPQGPQNVPLSAQIAAAEKAGNLNEVIALKAMMLNPSTN